MAVNRIAALVAVGAGFGYLRWRVSTLHGTGALGKALLGAEAINVVAIALTASLFWRARWRSGPVAAPAGTLDVFVTVCGEPVEMVEETLRAALGIAYPHTTYLLNDGRLAGKPGWGKIRGLGRRYGVRCFTRMSGKPGKAGNLNYALARTKGEFVATIDADHLARPEFAHETLGYFIEDGSGLSRRERGGKRVGFVSTPQQFEGETADLLNNREVLFYRYMQAAKDSDNAAHSCGNGAVYRREALDDIGGFSEWGIVEDLHTSYQLHARGWASVYHPRPLTAGIAPPTGSALARQRLRWATDGLRILLWDSPMLKRGLTWRQRLHYLHSTAYYLVACTQLLFLISPALYLLWRVPLVHVTSTRSYLVHSVPYFGALFGLMFLYGGIRGGLRSMQSVLWMAPVYLVALVRAATGIRFTSGVSEKGRRHRLSPLVLPQKALMLLLAASIAVAVHRRADGDAVAGLWAAWMVFSLGAFVTAVSARPALSRAIRVPIRAVAVGAVAALLASGGVGRLFVPGSSGSSGFSDVALMPVPWERLAIPLSLTHELPSLGVASPGEASEMLALDPPSRGAYLGFFNPELLKTPDSVYTWESLNGARATIVNWYQQWFSGETRFRKDWMANIARQGGVPMITWEPWAKPANDVHDAHQPQARLAVIASGRYDRYIRSWARSAAAYRRPILIRFMHEMNGFWYPWAVRVNGNTPRDFVRAWRHVHDIFQQEGAANVRWVWSIGSFTGLHGDNRDLRSYYPGADYVDWVSMTGFNWGQAKYWNRWHTFDEVFGLSYRALVAFDKPVMISEIGTVPVGGDPARWVQDGLRRLEQGYAQVKAVVWFDSTYEDGVDFRLQGASHAAVGNAVDASRYWGQTPRFSPVSSEPQPQPSTRRGSW
jgi:cellulose synthase (UDP-forming)